MFKAKEQGSGLLIFILLLLVIVLVFVMIPAVTDSSLLARRCVNGDMAACAEHQAKYAWLSVVLDPTPAQIGAPCPECESWRPTATPSP